MTPFLCDATMGIEMIKGTYAQIGVLSMLGLIASAVIDKEKNKKE